MKVEVIGAHRVVGAGEPCWLVELVASEIAGTFDVCAITQPVPRLDRSSWQVPYDEQVLDVSGRRGRRPETMDPIEIRGSLRLAFFFHYLDLTRPLLTPAGPVRLPRETPRPRRLGFMRYEEP